LLCALIFAFVDLAAAAVNVTLISDTGSQLVLPDAFSFLDEAVIDTVDVNFGQLGTTATISGRYWLGGGASIANVTLAYSPVLSIESFNDSYVIVRAGPPVNNMTVGDVLSSASICGATVEMLRVPCSERQR
jgi:hypothetical protein